MKFEEIKKVLKQYNEIEEHVQNIGHELNRINKSKTVYIGDLPMDVDSIIGELVINELKQLLNDEIQNLIFLEEKLEK